MDDHRLSRAIAAKALATRVDEVIAMSGMTEKRDTFCKGLSRGMVQRIGMARAVLHKPKLLLLDEPASGLDPLARKRLFDVLRAAHAEGATVLISSHILGELSELCSSVGILSRGHLLTTGPTRQVIKSLLQHRKIELTVLPDTREAAVGVLDPDPSVNSLKLDTTMLRFNFQGEDSDLADLHRRLVHAGVGVVTLAESASSLHEAYFAIAEKEGTDAQA